MEVGGRVTALIELGAGFHPEITGRENVLINGMLLGLTRGEVEERMPAIIEFADIGDFIDQPVKTYSSGMYVRLGFAVAVSADPDILLIDEVLAVGDAAFTRRCLDHLARMRQRGVTMVLVSHDLDLVTSFADRALYLEGGRQVAVGPADAVVARYRVTMPPDEGTDASQAPAPTVRVIEEGKRWGNGDVEIVEVEVLTGGSSQRLLPGANRVASGSATGLTGRSRISSSASPGIVRDGTLVSGHNTELGGLSAETPGRGRRGDAASTMRWSSRRVSIASTSPCMPGRARLRLLVRCPSYPGDFGGGVARVWAPVPSLGVFRAPNGGPSDVSRDPRWSVTDVERHFLPFDPPQKAGTGIAVVPRRERRKHYA